MKTLIVLFAVVAMAYGQLGFQKNRYQPAQPSYQQKAVISHHSGDQVPILRQTQDVNYDGSYQFDFETGNGIAAQEQGTLKNANTDYAAEAVQGSYRYTAPDGSQISVSYVADENGYQPVGAHLPVPPPIPDAILRSLEWIRTHPAPEEKKPIQPFNRNRF